MAAGRKYKIQPVDRAVVRQIREWLAKDKPNFIVVNNHKGVIDYVIEAAGLECAWMDASAAVSECNFMMGYCGRSRLSNPADMLAFFCCFDDRYREYFE